MNTDYLEIVLTGDCNLPWKQWKNEKVLFVSAITVHSIAICMVAAGQYPLF